MIYNDTKYNKNWEIKKLSQLGEFARGKSKHRPRNDKKLFEGGGYPLIQTGDIKESNLFVKKHSVEYNDFGLNQSKLWESGTLCITIAANIAETAVLKYPMCFPDSVVGFNAYENESSSLFMHYVFTYIKQAIQKSASGSIQDNINLEYLSSLEFRIPSKEYQDKIVKVLGTIDSKIENLIDLNELLNKMIKNIYEYNFIEFENSKSKNDLVYNDKIKNYIPKNWKIKKLSELVEVNKTPFNSLSSVDVIDLSIMSSSMVYVDKLNTSDNFSTNLFNLKEGDLLFGSIRPYLKKACISPINGAVTGTIFSLKPINNDDYNFCFATLTNDRIFDYAMKVSKGTKMPVVGIDDLLNYEIPYSKEASKKFNEIPLKNNIIYNSKLIMELKKIRDFLLPLLMTGEIKIED